MLKTPKHRDDLPNKPNVSGAANVKVTGPLFLGENGEPPVVQRERTAAEQRANYFGKEPMPKDNDADDYATVMPVPSGPGFAPGRKW